MYGSLLRRNRRRGFIGGLIGALIGGSAGAAGGASIGPPLVVNTVDGMVPLALIGIYFGAMIGILVAGTPQPEDSDSQ